MTAEWIKRLAAVLAVLILTACAGEHSPLALQKIDPQADASGVMAGLVGNDGEPPDLLDAIVKQGVPQAAARQALFKYDEFADQVVNTEHLVVIDMTRHSGQERFFLVHRPSGKVDALPTAHGSGSDPKDSGLARYFSNVPDSRMTSLGAYLVQEKYFGRHGDSLRLDGLERTNNRARERAIVLHSASYVKDGQSKQGRSWGCPAVPLKWMQRIIERLANGAFMYIHGQNERDTSGDERLIANWDLLARDLWISESEDAPAAGE